MEGMDIQRLLTGGAIGGVAITIIVTMWSKLKASWHYATGYIFQRIDLSDDAARIVLSHLVKFGKVSRVRDRHVSSYPVMLKKGHHEQVLYEDLQQCTFLLWYRRWPILISKRKAGEKELRHNNSTELQLSFLRGSIDIDKVLIDADHEFNAGNIACWNQMSASCRRFFIRRIPSATGRGDKVASSPSESGMPWYQMKQNRLLTHTEDEIGQPLTFEGKALDNLFFPEHIENLQHEIILWRQKRDWYRSKGLPWKRGWLLYGPPGTGKTALARSFAEDLDIPIFVYNLAEMGNSELRRSWQEMQAHTPCIALIEDIDAVFHGRENVTRQGSMGMSMFFGPHEYDSDEDEDDVPPGGLNDGKYLEDPPVGGSGSTAEESSSSRKRRNRGGGAFQPLTFDCLLNVLDGVERLEGILTIISTNDISKVDEAIGKPTGDNQSTRPGRIDRVIELTYMTKRDKKRMAHRILKEYPGELEALYQEVDDEPETKKETPSQFQERCAQVALKRLWEDEAKAKGVP